MSSARIKSNIHDYSIFYESGFSFLDKILKTENAVFIVDENILRLYPKIANGIDPLRLVSFKAIEENKTYFAAEKIIDGIIERKPNKKTTLVSFGGGIIQDVTGFAASIFYRGINWIYVPTTLLAQSDSCMGSKTSLNYKSFKNILGTFYPPYEIYICPDFLTTLTEEDFYSGMGEVAKLHLMSSEADVKTLAAKLGEVKNKNLDVVLDLIQQSLKFKWVYMENDEFDKGKRNLLNYGHDFGHAIESATHYKIPHGQAIIIGMMMANQVSAWKGAISDEKRKEINSNLLLPLLKTNYKMLKEVPAEAVIGGMKRDKKRIGAGLPLIMLNADHTLNKITDLTEGEATQAYNQFINEFC